jgi:hypothetical protein
MGMCAIYTALPDPPPGTDLAEIASRVVDTEIAPGAATQTGWRTFPFGRRAMEALAVVYAPPSRQRAAEHIASNDLYPFLKPGVGAHEDAMLSRLWTFRTSAGLAPALPVPLWPESVVLACVVGAPPAQVVTPKAAGSNVPVTSVAFLRSHSVRDAVAALEKHERAGDELVMTFLRFFAGARDRGDAVMLHWDYR